jgi:hypothetical protein
VAGFGLSRSTACRYLDEPLRVLSNHAPDLQEALDPAAVRTYAYLIRDGTVCGGFAGIVAEATLPVLGNPANRHRAVPLAFASPQWSAARSLLV